jgi:hypothetical protein
MTERPEQAIKWLTDKGVLHNTRKELLDYITHLEAENERLRDCIRWLEPDVKDIDAWMKGCKVAIQKVKEIRERGNQ